jgi:hypothetical protein
MTFTVRDVSTLVVFSCPFAAIRLAGDDTGAG